MTSSPCQPSERTVSKTICYQGYLFPISEEQARRGKRQTPSLPHNPPWRDERAKKAQHVRKGLQRSFSVILPSFRYSYQPVDVNRHEIRLLTIHAGSSSDPISCTIFHISLSISRVPYETISYCWGSGRSRAVIELNNTLFLVPKNAALALQRMRDTTHDRVVWIDSVCINQEDEGERNSQVAMMGGIYKRASTNLIWLGDDAGNAGAVADCLRAVLQNIDQATIPFQSFVEAVSTPEGRFSQDCTYLDSGIDTTPLVNLFSSPWWSRLWIVQEAAVARTNVCHFGDTTIPLLDILRVAAWLMFNQTQVPERLHRVTGVAHAWNIWHLVDREHLTPSYVDSLTQDLSTLHRLLGPHACTRPRDRIYALLGLYNPRHPSPEICSLLAIEYDATKKSTAVVFRDATRAMITETQSLDVLPALPSSLSSSPSWILRSEPPHPSDPVPFAELFTASASLAAHTPHLRAVRDPSVLTLRGVPVGKVARASPSLSPVTSEDSSAILAALVRAWGLLLGLPREAEEYMVEFTWTLLAGVNAGGERVGTKDFEDYNALIAFLRSRGRVPGLMDGSGREEDEEERASRYLEALQIACYARKFFVTPEGMLGLGPESVQEGDEVAVLFGAKVPYVLRYVKGGNHRIVGACYVHGIMDGEAVSRFQDSGRHAQSFRIV